MVDDGDRRRRTRAARLGGVVRGKRRRGVPAERRRRPARDRRAVGAGRRVRRLARAAHGAARVRELCRPRFVFLARRSDARFFCLRAVPPPVRYGAARFWCTRSACREMRQAESRRAEMKMKLSPIGQKFARPPARFCRLPTPPAHTSEPRKKFWSSSREHAARKRPTTS